jgi:hypothetical protein
MAKFKPLPPLAELQKYLSYCPETGVFTWASKPSKHIPVGAVCGKVLPSGYRQVCFQKQSYYAHRLAFYIGTGVDPKDRTVDHINLIKDDNSIRNLRLATFQQQQGNKRKQSNNTSGFRGVVWHKKANKWWARIKIDGIDKSLGLHSTKAEAAAAYQEAATAYFGDFKREAP